MRPLLAAALVLALAAPAWRATARAADPPAFVAQAVADPARPAADRGTDASRLPAETLDFAGVRPGMTVAEFFPGGGYFTRMLAGVVGPTGHVYGLENAGWKGAVKADEALLAGGGFANVTMSAAPMGQFALPAPVDLVWVTQNYHDLKIAEYGSVDTADFNRRVFAALKPGGTYLVVDHEAPAGTPAAAIAKLHRIEKSVVIAEVTAAGFRLADEGAFLHRPADDHTLPIFDKAIQGKTDQYALKFIKPRA